MMVNDVKRITVENVLSFRKLYRCMQLESNIKIDIIATNNYG